MAPESGGRAPTIDTASGWALAKAFTLWRTVGPGGAAAGSSKAPMARVLRAREKSGRRRNMAASRSALRPRAARTHSALLLNVRTIRCEA